MTKDITKETLKKIRDEHIQPRPKSYFQLLKILTYGLSTILFIVAIYIFNLMFYLPNRGPRIVGKLGIMHFLSLFPWPLLIIGSLIIGLLIYLYKNYEGGYKTHLWVSALIIFLVMLIGGSIMAGSRFNERLEERPRFRKFYQWNEDNFVPKGPRERFRKQHLNLRPPQIP